MTRKHFLVFMAVVLILSTFAVPALAAPASQTAGPIQTAAEQYFAGGTKNMKASDLFATLNDGDDSNDPMIIDIRKAEDFANGHIPGAVNMNAATLFTAAELAKLPQDEPIVVNCYTGQTSSQTVAGLRMLGYDAYSLLYGIPSWGVNDKIKYLFLANQSGGYAVTQEPATFEDEFEAPAPLAATVAAAAETYYGGGFKSTKASDVFANLNDGDDSNNPMILDMRSADDYALGHLPGAINVAAKDLFKADMLAMLPADQQIVAYCYSGQTASQATAALRLLGYDAYNMQFGMPSWAIVEGVSTGVWDDSKSGNYTLEGAAATAAAEPVAAAAAPAAATPATLPVTGAPIAGLVLLGLALAGAGAALRRR
jgi:rhodanese-related sulfurtransferase